jgi:hypothetical protein
VKALSAWADSVRACRPAQLIGGALEGFGRRVKLIRGLAAALTFERDARLRLADARLPRLDQRPQFGVQVIVRG